MSDLIDRYYATFEAKGDFADLPLTDDFVFSGPGTPAADADTFRAMAGGIASMLQGIEIDRQLRNGDTAITTYGFDLGLPAGPIRMAEAVTHDGDAISRIELFFDSAAMGGGE